MEVCGRMGKVIAESAKKTRDDGNNGGSGGLELMHTAYTNQCNLLINKKSPFVLSVGSIEGPRCKFLSY